MGEAISTVVYILNKDQIRTKSSKKNYELWKGIQTTIKYFKLFGHKCYIKMNKEKLGKIESINDEGILIRYAYRSNIYRFYNKRTQEIIESVDVEVDESPPHNDVLPPA